MRGREVWSRRKRSTEKYGVGGREVWSRRKRSTEKYGVGGREVQRSME